MKEKLMRKVNHLKVNDIQYILEELGKENDSLNSKEIEIETMGVSDEEIALIKEVLIFLVDEDDGFRQKFQYIIESDNRTLIADIFNPSEIQVLIVGIVTLGTIANNLIKAKYPSEEITKKDKDGNTEKETRRNYSSIADAVSSLASLSEVKNKKDDIGTE